MRPNPLVLLASACLAALPLHAEIRLSGSLEGRPLSLSGTRNGFLVVTDGTTRRAIDESDGVSWSLEFDPVSDAGFIIWSPQWTISRATGPDKLVSPDSSFVAALTASRRLSSDSAILPLAGDYWMKWLPESARTGVLIVAWIEGGRATRVRLIPIPRDETERFPDSSLQLGAPSLSGRMVALLWTDGPAFLPVRSAVDDPVFDLVQSMALDDTASLAQAVAAHGKLDAIAGPLLSAAAKGGCTASARWIIEKAPKSVGWADEIGRTALHVAAMYVRTDIVDALVASRAAPSPKAKYEGTTPLHLACQYGFTDVVSRLLAHRADRNAKDLRQRTPLGWAIDNGFADIAALVYRPSFDFDLIREETEAIAITQSGQGHSAMVAWLVSKGIRTDRTHLGRTAILAGTESGDAALLSAVLKGGASLDTANEQGLTVLMLAARHGNGDYTRALLDAGASIDAIDQNGRSALHHAAIRNRTDILRLLLDRGARSDLGDASGLTPLDIAVIGGFPEGIATLAAAGARVNLGSPLANDVLLAAIRLDLVEIIRGALADGWPPDAELRPGWPARSVAEASRSTRCSQLLSDAGAGAAHPIPLVPSRSLDAPLQVIETGPVVDPRDIDDNYPAARVFVETILHSDGSTIGPIVRQSEFPELTAHAIRSVAGARFAPITHDGKPAVTVIKIPVTFPAAADRITPMKEVDEQPRAITQPSPIYPRRSKYAGVEARVVLRFTIGTDGIPADIRVISTTGVEFSEAALAAIAQWRFQPAMKAGQPVAVRMVQPLSFTLRK